MPPKRPPLEPVYEDDPPVAEDLLRQMTALCALLSQQLPSSTSAAQPSSEPPLRLNLTIPTFSGYSDAKSVEDFLADLEAYQTAVGATDEAVLRRILPAALVSSAAVWRRSQPAFPSMTEFQRLFREEFLPPDYAMRMREELMTRTQHAEESLLEYTRAIQELYRRAEPLATESEKVARAIRQCHPRFKPYFRGRRFSSLDDLAKEAHVIQADLLAELQYRPPPRPEQTLEPSCAWNGPRQSLDAELNPRGTVGTHGGSSAGPVYRSLDPFAYEQRNRARSARAEPREREVGDARHAPRQDRRDSRATDHYYPQTTPAGKPGTPAAVIGNDSVLSSTAENVDKKQANSNHAILSDNVLALVPLACRAQDDICSIGPFIVARVLSKDVAALVDTGAAVSLIGDTIHDWCRERNISVRTTRTCLRPASDAVVPAGGAVRLTLTVDGQRVRQRFIYLPGLAGLMILGRDFIIRMGLVLDLRRGGYQHASGTTFYPFMEWTTPETEQNRTGEETQDPGAGQSTSVELFSGAEHLTATVVPAVLEDVLKRFPGSPDQRRMLAKALRPFSCMFTERPGLTHALEHRIEIGDARPWRCNPRPLSVHKRKLLDAALDEMIETGAVRPSRSPWAFPVVLAPKKDGTARLCVDYRRLNEVTVRDSYPFPSIDSIMYSLGSAHVFTTLDCSRGFLQIPIAPDDVEKTAFTCHRGLFEFVRLPFGLSNSPASFQRVMDEVLSDAKYNFAMAYMDDVVIFSRTFQEHLSHLKVVLERMQAA
ncbi:uncharacterized protein LOC135370435 [Ornithodoros turicata]|uniref:uncharacterized protein LOC135370435 n=1 Tax=Ornithodoros turicata TaxID=34597 RepID=UPI003139FE97